MAIVTKPVLLDETGKDIKDALDSASASILASITDGYNKDMTLQEVVDARGEYTSLGQRLNNQDSKTDQLEQELEETLQDVRDYVDDAADQILADITDEFNIDGTLQEVVDARGDFVSLGQRLDSDDERLGVLEQTTKDLEYWKTTNNALPKVEGEGTDITLDNTADSPLTLGFKASENTQNSTTGKNLLPNLIESQTISGVQITKNADGSLTLNGTSTSGFNLNINYQSGKYVALENGQAYKMSLVNNSGLYFRLAKVSDNTIITSFDTPTTNKTFTSNYAGDTYAYFTILNNTTFNNLTIYPMLRLASITDDTYEPYTNGASPNPEYPQDMHVVKGDNEVVIENKNYFSSEIESGTYNGAGQKTENSNRLRNKNAIYLKKGTYTLSSNSNFSCYIYTYISDVDRFDTVSSLTSTFMNLPYTFTLDDNCYLLIIFNKNNTQLTPKDLTSPQIELGNQATSYVEHKEQNYPLNLGVENKFNGNFNNIAFWNTDVGQSTTMTSGNNYLGAYCEVEEGQTYSISREKITNRFVVAVGNEVPTTSSTALVLAKNNTGDKIENITIPTGYNYLYLYLSNNSETSDNIKIQIEEGPTAHSYSPYGQTPIEMCNISNYADEIFKNVPECEYYDNTLEVGKWYKYGRIGKVVLDGSEVWKYTNGVFYINGFLRFVKGQPVLSNYFRYGGSATNTTTAYQNGNNTISFNVDDGSSIYIRNDSITNINDFNDWLSTHNTEVYYVLATPTKTLLSDTLQEQLDNISYAMAYQDQTNISQNNEDRPFVISASTVLDLNTLVTRVATLESEV